MKEKNKVNYKAKTKHAVKWNIVLSFSTKIVALVVGVVLARLLFPKDYGTMAMANVFLGFFTVFVNGGTASSVIQKKDISQTDLSTIFIYNVVIGLLVSFIIFFIAGPVALYYKEPAIKPIVQVIAWLPLINAVSIVQQNLMLRNINFKSKVLSQLAGQIFAGAVGITLAFMNYGVWALVWSSVVGAIFSGILYWIQGGWMPSLIFSNESFKKTWSYSSKILYGNLLNIIFLRIDLLLLGRFLNPSALGIYYKGKTFADIPIGMTNEILTKSYFPILSRLNEREDFNKFYLAQSERILILSTFIFTFLIITGDEIIKIIYGQKWAGAIVFFKLACIYGFFRTNNSISAQAINSLGRSDLNFKRMLYLAPARVGLIVLPFVFPVLMRGEFFLWVLIITYALLEIIANYDISRLQDISFRIVLIKHIRYIIVGTGIVVFAHLPWVNMSNMYLFFLIKTAAFFLIWFLIGLIDKKVKETINFTIYKKLL